MANVGKDDKTGRFNRKAMKKEVLIISSEFPPGPGGIGSHAFSMAKAFHRKGVDVTVVCPADYVTTEEALDFDRALPFKVHRYSRQGWKGYLGRLVTIRRHLKKNIILSGKFPLWTVNWIRLLKGHKVRVVSVLHGSEVNPSNALIRKFTHNAISKADAVVAVSKFTATLLPECLQSSLDIKIIPNGIDLKSFPESERIKLKGNPSILTVGSVTPRKGQHRVIKALPEILKKYPDAHYHIVGLPVYQKKFEEIATGLGVRDNITFHGRVESRSDLYSYYRSADVFAILSENQKDGDCEGFGIVILEAGYYGLPTIGAKGCGIEDAISEGVNGYLVDGDDASEITKQIGRIYGTREKLAPTTIDWSMEHSWDEIILKFIELI